MKNIGKPCAGEPHARFDDESLFSTLPIGCSGTAARADLLHTHGTVEAGIDQAVAGGVGT
jgi:hypothetical protein